MYICQITLVYTIPILLTRLNYCSYELTLPLALKTHIPNLVYIIIFFSYLVNYYEICRTYSFNQKAQRD